MAVKPSMSILMDDNNRLDEHKLIAALLHDIHLSHGSVFNSRSLRQTTKVVERRLRLEGIGFLTKTLPRLGKAFDKALSNNTRLTAIKLGWKAQRDSELPLFCGEFFNRVLNPDGTVLLNPCADSVRILRQILYLFYKYELPYTDEQEQKVIDSFERTESDILARSVYLRTLYCDTDRSNPTWKSRYPTVRSEVRVARKAQILLERVFQGFDFTNIKPAHGPGAVATRQKQWEKYVWSNVSSRLTTVYPYDAYFCASMGHVCDTYNQFEKVGCEDLPARVVLVPKDSRGPRLISCEPVDFQWIQQGIMRSLVRHVETLPLTRHNVFFTDQAPNQRGALLGSSTGRYATLDLNEASDRVSLDLVRLLFPEHVCTYLEACRSSSTELPDGRIIKLNKFAPMGLALCFPILALTVWAILTAAAPDADTRDSILVYGDDVIVPTAYAANAMEQLESFGLKINRDKSCTSGLFRESCGTDAFNGINVTPVRLRTVWSSSRSPESLTSWISYANSFYERKYFGCYDYIVDCLHRLYGCIPSKDMGLTCPSLYEVPDYMVPKRSRINKRLQKREYNVWDVKAPSVHHTLPGWSMLLRFFSEKSGSNEDKPSFDNDIRVDYEGRLPLCQRVNVEGNDYAVGSWEKYETSPLSVSLYTNRRTSMLVRRWR